MVATTGIFEIERDGETYIITPLTNIGELAFREIDSGAADILDQLNDSSARNIVFDFCRTDFFGTTALGFFLRLWKRVRARNGHMVFCNASAHERELFQLTKLESLWAVYGSRHEALRAVGA